MERRDQDLSTYVNIILVGLLFLKIEEKEKKLVFSILHLLVAIIKTQQFKS